MSPSSTKRVVIGADSFGDPLRLAIIQHLTAKGVEVDDVGVGKYYEVAEEASAKVADGAADGSTKGILLCGSGMGMAIVANKRPGVRAAVVENVATAVNSRSINDTNVLTLGAMITTPEAAVEIVDEWLAAEFKGPAPANEGKGWPEEIQSFLTQSLPDIARLEGEMQAPAYEPPCILCALAGSAEHPFGAVAGVEGAEWVQLRENPTRALVRFKAGSVEPAHHHTHGHDVFVVSGRKTVENLTRGEVFELEKGSYLYTAGGELHRVTYHTDTEFVICCDGKFDVTWDE